MKTGVAAETKTKYVCNEVSEAMLDYVSKQALEVSETLCIVFD